MFQNLTEIEWVVVILCALLIGFAKSGIAGTGTIVIPLMASIFPAGRSTGVLLPMLVVGDIFAVFFYRTTISWKHVLRPLPCALAGVVIGWALVYTYRPGDHYLKIIIGVIVLAMLAIQAWRQWRNGFDAKEMPLPAVLLLGLGGGIATMLANAAGPVFIVYLLAMNLPKEEFNGTRAVIFLLLNLFKLPFSHNLGYIDPASLLFNMKMLLLIPLGAFIGKVVVVKINQRTFGWAVWIMTIVASAKLLLDGFRG